MKIHIPAILSAAGIVILSASATLGASATKLAGMDPLAIDADKLSFAAVMPVPLKLRTGDVVLSFVVNAPAPYGPVKEIIPLEITAGGKAPGVTASPSFERVQIARVAKADLARLSAAQAKARAFRATGRKDGKGSISISIIGGCRDGIIGDGPLVAALYLRSASEDQYVPLVASVDLETMVKDAAIGKRPVCADSKG